MALQTPSSKEAKNVVSPSNGGATAGSEQEALVPWLPPATTALSFLWYTTPWTMSSEGHSFAVDLEGFYQPPLMLGRGISTSELKAAWKIHSHLNLVLLALSCSPPCPRCPHICQFFIIC